jgi:hypothetical protein
MKAKVLAISVPSRGTKRSYLSREHIGRREYADNSSLKGKKKEYAEAGRRMRSGSSGIYPGISNGGLGPNTCFFLI